MGYIHRHPQGLVEARFVSRPHRFAVRCALAEGGAEVEAHMADPGRLVELLVPGARVMLAGPFGPPRKLAWSAVMVAQGEVWVNLITTLPNALFPALLEGGHLPGLPLPQRVVGLEREVAVGSSRLDFRVFDDEDDDGVLVEVKSVTLRDAEGVGRFPDAPSQRARRHLEELAGLAQAGQRAAVVFVMGRGDLEVVAPASGIDPDFAVALREAAEAGVSLLAVGVTLDLEGARDPRPGRVEVS